MSTSSALRPLSRTPVLIMAGGSGQRMTKSGIPLPKPLVPILGVSLLERNLMQLIRQGARHIDIALPSSIPSLEEYYQTRVLPLLNACQIQSQLIIEERPLGTIGAAELFDVETLLVVNADNITDMDLNSILQSHHKHRAAMTIALHEEPFTIPFAQVITEKKDKGEKSAKSGIWVKSYREKPTLGVDVASAVYVLSRQAQRTILPDENIGAPTLVQRLLDEDGSGVHAWRHQANWIDVNHATAVQKACSMIQNNSGNFETIGEPDVVVVGAIWIHQDKILLEYRPSTARCYPNVWDSPGGKLEQNESSMQAIRRELKEELGLQDICLNNLCSFDDIDPHSQKIFRHHVFILSSSETPVAQEGQSIQWFSLNNLPTNLAIPTKRSLAWHLQQGMSHA